MKITTLAKYAGLGVMVLGLAMGCASAQKGKGVDMAAQAAQAIAAAKAARNKAAAVGYEWRDTGKLIKKAQKALKKKDYKKAIKLANKARRQGELAALQEAAERARIAAMFAKDSGTGSSASSSYTVAKGDSLWRISGKADIYSNPFQWPLIYKANSGSIKDADLIYPGQGLSIPQSYTSAEADAAVNHAKTRGAWSLGAVEDSDKAYLAR